MLLNFLKGKIDLNKKQRENLGGYLFTLPFIIGFILFFLYPFIQSVIFSVNNLQFSTRGYELLFNGFDNYRYSFLVHPHFTRYFIETILDLIRDLPLILAFSLFIAIILNQKFKGRLFARAIFFLPVIIGAGIVLRLQADDYAMIRLVQEGETIYYFSTDALRDLLMNFQIPEIFLNYIMGAIDVIPQIIRSSAIQILIFLAGLQSIPSSIYESAKVEGATGWESFWLITLPMISPLILTNMVYTIIDSFSSPSNRLVSLIHEVSHSGAGYGVSMAMSVVYFAATFILLITLIKLASRWVFYQE